MIFDDYGMWEPDKEFEQQVVLGALVKYEVRELCEPYMLNGHLIKGEWSRFYALKDEAWRIPAFMLLKKLMKKASLERCPRADGRHTARLHRRAERRVA
jgi:hypothetical protein